MKKFSKGNKFCLRNYAVSFKVLKTAAFVMLCSVMCLQTNAAGQQKLISVEYHNESLKNVIKDLVNKTSYQYFYNSKEVNKYKGISFTLKDAGISVVLDNALKGTELNYKVDGDIVYIKKSTQTDDSQKRIKIKGKVTDEKGNPLPGVSIIVKGTTVGVTTDEEGNYSIDVPESGMVLVFSFVGMQSNEQKADVSKTLNVTLSEDKKELQEVVVTGIFKKNKESYTGSAVTVTEKELKMFGSRNVLTTLKNIDPGFNIISSNELGSNPNAVPEINIRGTSSLPSVSQLESNVKANLNTPLVIMDGFEISLQRMMDINDSEIESITLLKDASATAIYGSRGANGVVVIKTKEPVSGKLKLTYRGSVNIETPDLSEYDLLNAKEKLELERIVGLYANPRPGRNTPLQEKYYDRLYNVNQGKNTDWLSKPLRNGVGQRHNIRLDGGDKLFRYSVGLDYNNIEGVMKASSRNTFNGSINLSYRAENFLFKNQLTIGKNTSKNSPYGKFSDYVTLNPYWSIYDEDGQMLQILDTDSYTYSSDLPENPLYNATLNGINQTEYISIINNFSIEWNISDELILRGQFGITKRQNTSDHFISPKNTKYLKEEYLKPENSFRKGEYTYGTGEKFEYNSSITLNYNKLIANMHNLYLGMNIETAESSSHSYSFLVEGFPNENLDFIPGALQYRKGGKPKGKESKTRRIGFTGNVNYSFDNRYFMDLSYRTDGSSQFGTNKRFAPFYSVGAGWNIHRESFIDESSWCNRLKLKASLGTTGSQQFDAYQAMSTYSYILDDKYLTWMGAHLKGLGNEDLEWQKTEQYNMGIESLFFKSRLKLNVDVYLKKTSNLLSAVAIPYSNGFSNYIENVGEVENRGYEIMASYYLIRDTEQRFMWSVTGKIAYNENEITRLSDALKQQNTDKQNKKFDKDEKFSNPNQLIFEGDPMNSIYVVPSQGIDPATGKELFVKKNGEVTYEWDSADRVFAGVSVPKYNGNMSTYVRYKDFSLNLSLGFHFGGKQYNQTLVDKVENVDYRYNVDRRVYTDRWQKPGDISKYKGLNVKDRTRYSSRFVQDDNVLECQNINLMYELKTDWIKSAGLKNLNISCNLSDLFYISSIKRERGTNYPFSRKISFSLMATF